MSINDFDRVKNKIDYVDFYSKYFDLSDSSRSSNANHSVLCCFHEDKNKSLSINLENGEYNCFGCNASGDVFTFYEKRHSTSKFEALVNIARMYGVKLESKNSERPEIDPEYVESCHKTLNGDFQLRKMLFEKKGILEETRIKYKIGYDTAKRRFTIPVYENGNLVNVRIYSFGQNIKPKNKMMSHYVPKSEEMFKEHQKRYEDLKVRGDKRARKPSKNWSYGESRTYGIDDVAKTPGVEVFICEGEWDALLLRQKGFLSITVTAGCHTLPKKEHFNILKDRDIVVVYDLDTAGRNGAEKICEALCGIAKTIKDVRLYVRGDSDDNDIGDYFLKPRPTGEIPTEEDFIKLVDDTPYYEPLELRERQKELQLKEIKSIEVEDIEDLDRINYEGKRIKIEFTVSGISFRSYRVPKFVRLRPGTCKKINDCENAAKCLSGTSLTIKDREYHGACSCSDGMIEKMLKRKVCIFNERGIIIDVNETENIREYFIKGRSSSSIFVDENTVDETSSGSKDKKMYYTGEVDVNIKSYIAHGYVSRHPKGQDSIFAADTLEPIADEWEAFTVNEKTMKDLDTLRKYSTDEILKDLSDHVTKIYKREDILMLVLLSYLSPLWVNFNDEDIIGLFHICIIGDSGTGKSSIFTKIRDFIGVGEYIRGETTSRTGIVYGMSDEKDRGWDVKAGAYIEQNKKLLCVDEAQKVSETDISHFDQGIDQGKIKIKRIASAEFTTLTRIVLICNPKNNQPLMEYSRPCLSLKTVFEPMFIRRLDGIGFCSSHDNTDPELLNRLAINKEAQKVTKDMLRSLVYLMWNMKKRQITFLEDATKRCLELTIVMSKKFGFATDLKIVAPDTFRNTLAKASVGFAALSMNFNNDYTELIITKKHVELAYDMFNRIYSSKNCCLDLYSSQKKSEDHLPANELEVIKTKLIEQLNEERHTPAHTGMTPKIIGLLQSHSQIKKFEIADFLGLEPAEVTKKVRLFNHYNMVKSDKDGYHVKSKFNLFVDECLRSNIFAREDMEMGADDSEISF